ncbi:hypothetical protein ACSYAD_19700 [Acaryochloris marina NIES-2412]|uniref:hypothetical protein n=1 Tax=Acaryochloris marina TaxID=155978 RepID=UPI00405A0E61
MASDPSQMTESNEKPLAIAVRNFLIGVFLSGIPILACLWLSVDMTYGSWAAVGTGRLIGAILVPLICGILAAALGRKVIDFLSVAAEGAQLPF